jgi:hypothetical protein
MPRKPRLPPEVVFPGELQDDPPPPEERQEARRWSTELTPGLVEQLVACARVGAFKRTAALSCGVRPDQLEFWLSEGMRYGAPALMHELSARFYSAGELMKLSMLEVAVRAGRSGNPAAALDVLKMSDPLYRNETVEQDATPPELSQEQRYELLVQALRQPEGEMARAMREAGVATPLLFEPVNLDTQNEGSAAAAERRTDD